MKEKDYHKRNFLKFPLISTQDEYDKKVVELKKIILIISF